MAEDATVPVAEAATVPMEEAATVPMDGEADPGAVPEKKKRGKPKDAMAPPKPKNANQVVSAKARQELKEKNPEAARDLAVMGKHLKEVWEATPQEEKDRLTAEYEKEMEIWRPKWAAYKETDHYKEFCEIKQDWLDVREKKKLFKAHSKQAPKKPQSGYMIFGGTIRDRVKEEVAAAGGGMGDIGKKISEEWQALSEAKKAEYDEMSAKQKEVFTGLYAEHKKTDIFRKFMEDKAKMDGRHKVKKLERTTYKEAPKRPKSAFQLFKDKVLKQVMEENKGAAAGELGKKVGEKWKACEGEQRAVFENEAAALKADYLAKLKDFKRKKVYTKFLYQRHLTRARENKQVHLREMPKKPRSVFSLFREDHKDEVPAGKGEGKGMSWVKAKYQEASEEEKAKYLQKEKELKAKWEEDVKAYKESEKFKEYQKTEVKIKREMTNEAMKVMTLKFLDTAPQQPPKSAFSVYVGEKRKAQAEGQEDAANEPKAKKQKTEEAKEELVKFQAEWKKLDKETKAEYEEKRKDKHKAWQEEAKAYMALPMWKEYMEEAKMLKVSVKSLLSQKKQVIKKLKNGMRLLPLPEKPTDMPQKPPSAKRLFIREKRNEVEDLSTIPGLWDGLSPEERATWDEKYTQLLNQYEEQLRAFQQSEDGKTYLKKVKQTQKSRTIAQAKDKFLVGQPKKPPSVMAMYFKQELPVLKKAQPELKGFELKKVLEDKWKNLDDEAKKPLQDKAAAADAEYEATSKLFRESENYKAYAKVLKRVSGRKAKPKGKAKGKKGKPAPTIPQPKKPENMPVKPPDAMKLYMKAQTGSGKSLGDMFKAFKELPEEEKKAYEDQASETQQKYAEEYKAWEKSEEGKKYLREKTTFGKRKRLADAKAKFLKEQPKKPPNAMFLFCAENRAEVAKANPDLKGLGPVQKKLGEMWSALSEEDKKVYTDKHAEQMAAYNEKRKEFESTPEWKSFCKIAKGSSKPAPKSKGKGKGKGQKAAPKGPSAPDGMPKKPLSAMNIFSSETKPSGGIPGIASAWRELGAEGQKQYLEKAKEQASEYETQMKAFQATADGKRYLREKAAFEKKNKLNQAKEKHLGGAAKKQPKPPPTAYQLFVQEKRQTVQGNVAEVAKTLSTMWSECAADDKATIEAKAKDLKEAYDKEMAEYKSSDAFKAYEKAVKSVSKPKSKPKKKAAKAKGKVAKVAKVKAKAAPKKGGKKAAAAADSSDSDVMGSDSDSSSSDSDSD
mmetsp:Transcript_81078/g.142961  ORF Transcript_81078/g.142961 Transcript_81078/m.142961 type:complete len:1231 (+) Transcript_81078:30-3722(+)|eukprot:CAMPEP_0197648604 /NCGR_PEP_ID=MMETSP1338-20131121/27855_1 /TAXON_ID=43686 ORGANISM="Pelagodinium beii, Strain RCC1491" /NCGR_SAMPLE_ID=MMETSP1338 /ASSEMBLY_ACC=CAM_ASM_000754 /LENGTH=1230 /DNA_ID=CAMNT_0043222637 /DNA_START=30 /DNA_END=3722 /DNA_ORIENTATION=+